MTHNLENKILHNLHSYWLEYDQNQFIRDYSSRNMLEDFASECATNPINIFSVILSSVWFSARNCYTLTPGYDPFRVGHNIIIFGPVSSCKSSLLAFSSTSLELSRNLTYLFALENYMISTKEIENLKSFIFSSSGDSDFELNKLMNGEVLVTGNSDSNNFIPHKYFNKGKSVEYNTESISSLLSSSNSINSNDDESTESYLNNCSENSNGMSIDVDEKKEGNLYYNELRKVSYRIASHKKENITNIIIRAEKMLLISLDKGIWLKASRSRKFFEDIARRFGTGICSNAEYVSCIREWTKEDANAAENILCLIADEQIHARNYTDEKYNVPHIRKNRSLLQLCGTTKDLLHFLNLKESGCNSRTTIVYLRGKQEYACQRAIETNTIIDAEDVFAKFLTCIQILTTFHVVNGKILWRKKGIVFKFPESLLLRILINNYDRNSNTFNIENLIIILGKQFNAFWDTNEKCFIIDLTHSNVCSTDLWAMIYNIEHGNRLIFKITDCYYQIFPIQYSHVLRRISRRILDTAVVLQFMKKFNSFKSLNIIDVLRKHNLKNEIEFDLNVMRDAIEYQFRVSFAVVIVLQTLNIEGIDITKNNFYRKNGKEKLLKSEITKKSCGGLPYGSNILLVLPLIFCFEDVHDSVQIKKRLKNYNVYAPEISLILDFFNKNNIINIVIQGQKIIYMLKSLKELRAKQMNIICDVFITITHGVYPNYRSSSLIGPNDIKSYFKKSKSKKTEPQRKFMTLLKRRRILYKNFNFKSFISKLYDEINTKIYLKKNGEIEKKTDLLINKQIIQLEQKNNIHINSDSNVKVNSLPVLASNKNRFYNSNFNNNFISFSNDNMNTTYNDKFRISSVFEKNANALISSRVFEDIVIRDKK